MTGEELLFQEQLSQIGLPDDLAEVALKNVPGPSPQAAARMKATVLHRADGMRKRPVRAWYHWAAAAAMFAVLSVAAVGPSRVMAQVQALFSFIPGFGMQAAEGFLLYSPKPVELPYKGGTVEVPGVMVNGDRITVRVILRDYEEWPGPTQKMRLEDESGRLFKDVSVSGISRHLYWEEWLTFAGRVDARTRTLTLVIPDGSAQLRIPVPLVQAAGKDPLEQFGPSKTANDVTISARVRARPDRTEATLLLLSSTPLAEGLGRPTPWAIEGELAVNGRALAGTQESGGLGQMRTLSFDPLPPGVDLVRLSVGSLIVAEEGSATVTIPTSAGPVEKTVRLGRWDFQVTRTERRGDTLRVYLDLGPEGPTSLHGIWDISLVGEPSEVGTGNSIDNSRLLWFDLKLPRQQETVTLRFSHPEVQVLGPWVMDVPVQW